MSEREVKFLHSTSANDLGGQASVLEIAILPANNLFDDVTPEEADNGYTDYRCFYVVNKYIDTNYDISLNSTSATCTQVSVGSVVRNEEQKIIFQGSSPASDSNYFICQMDWGPQLTVYWGGSYAAMAANMQAQIRLVEYHESVTVSATSIYSGDTGAEFTITFVGQLINRKMGLVKIVQNNLFQGGIQEYRTDNTGATFISRISTISSTLAYCVPVGNYNCTGATAVQVHTTISNVPSAGIIHIPYPFNDQYTSSSWPYMNLSYTGYSGNIFQLATPIPTIPIPPDPNFNTGFISVCPCFGQNDECWVDMPEAQGNGINVTRIQEGSPINQTAQVIPLETIQPFNWTSQGASFHVGLLKPSEGFFVWVKRKTTAGTSGCKDGFSITLDGTKV